MILIKGLPELFQHCLIESDLTQKEIAGSLGVSDSTVSRIINGNTRVDSETFGKLMQMFGRSLYVK